MAKCTAAKVACTAFADLILVMVALASVQAQENPTGNCGVRANGSRAGYHHTSDVWIPDCRNPLRREYWRVFSKDGVSAYVIPRPDGTSELHPICNDPKHELRGIADRHVLCQKAASAEQVRIVNSMALLDARQIVHFLHGQLKFKTVTVSVAANVTMRRVYPYPIPSDIIEACALKRAVISARFGQNCQIEIREAMGIEREGAVWTGEEAAELASRLNELYGVQ